MLQMYTPRSTLAPTTYCCSQYNCVTWQETFGTHDNTVIGQVLVQHKHLHYRCYCHNLQTCGQIADPDPVTAGMVMCLRFTLSHMLYNTYTWSHVYYGHNLLHLLRECLFNLYVCFFQHHAEVLANRTSISSH